MTTMPADMIQRSCATTWRNGTEYADYMDAMPERGCPPAEARLICGFYACGTVVVWPVTGARREHGSWLLSYGEPVEVVRNAEAMARAWQMPRFEHRWLPSR